MIEFFPIKTRVFIPPKDDLFRGLDESIADLRERDVLMISSKVLAIHQGRCVRVKDANKLDLIRQEADEIICRIADPCVTIKEHAFVPNSGVDESNGNGYYILWPKNVGVLLKEIHEFLCKKFGLRELGILSIDSRVLPMRAGTVGISQASFGFVSTNDRVGESDLFGRPLEISQVNVADCLAGMGPLIMGEGGECCPIVRVRGLAGVTFCPNLGNLEIPKNLDLFGEIFEKI